MQRPWYKECHRKHLPPPSVAAATEGGRRRRQGERVIVAAVSDRRILGAQRGRALTQVRHGSTAFQTFGMDSRQNCWGFNPDTAKT